MTFTWDQYLLLGFPNELEFEMSMTETNSKWREESIYWLEGRLLFRGISG